MEMEREEVVHFLKTLVFVLRAVLHMGTRAKWANVGTTPRKTVVHVERHQMANLIYQQIFLHQIYLQQIFQVCQVLDHNSAIM